ncbi:substrate-binding domain-containing protein [Salipiger mangrovisoli]|uniref:LacI family DNA-binding transcriptional regulator n=1 Tax=Salipiger mangrovisoli TaxID=2865933 RepID=A0ABR9X5L2_9RHOB|nr:LacI family DNA-binding transcriptional regulator [Salipiger mangrovisoli]
MNTRPVTSIDVAKRAGVSQSAVSRFYTPGGSVSNKMAEKIRKAAEELGYHPNVLARAMITGRSRIIGLMVYYFENQFYPESVEKLSIALQREGYHVLLFMAQNTIGDVEPIIQEFLGYRVDGIIMVSVSLSSTLADRCRDNNIPVVLFNRDQPGDSLRAVTSDNYQGGRMAAEILLRGGAERIGHMSGYRNTSTQTDREKGFRDTLAEAGRKVHALDDGNFHYIDAVAAARRMFSAAEPPDALFVSDDHMAMAALDVIRFEFGLRVPEDVAVVGFDDIPQASMPSFNLTTIRQPLDEMVGVTVADMVEAIEGGTEIRKRRLMPEAVIRGTTRG